MLATINDLVFPVFLFAVYLCAASVILYNPKQQHQSSQDIAMSELETSLEVEVTVNKTSEETQKNSPPELPITPERQLFNDLHPQVEEIISHLNKRQSRQLCKPLNIQQKCGSVEKTLTFIKAEIRSLFKDDPEKVIAAIQEKLPELICLPTEANEQAEKIAS